MATSTPASTTVATGTKGTDQNPASTIISPLPLAASLQTTLHVLIRRLGHLLLAQSRLQASTSRNQAAYTKPLPGYDQVLAAAQKWQKDVTALNAWVNQAKDALDIEYEVAKKREEVEAAAAADLALKQAQEAEKEQQSKGDAGNVTAVDLTGDDDDDDDKPLGDGSKRPRDDQTASQDASAKRVKLDGDGSQPTVGNEQPPSNGSGTEAQFDFSSLGLPGFDMNALINMAQQSQNQQQTSSTDMQATPHENSTSAPFDNANFDMSQFDMMAMGNADSLNMGMDFGSMQGDGSGNDTGLNNDNVNNNGDDPTNDASGMGMDFGAALEGVDWSSLLENMGGNGQGGGQYQ